MVLKVFNFINIAFSNAAAFFVIIIEECGMTGVYLSAIFIMLLFKFILGPIFGRSIVSGSGSDKVTKQNKGGKNG